MTQPPSNGQDPKLPSWAREPASLEQKKRNNRRALLGVGVVLGVLLVVAIVSALVGSNEDSDENARVDVTVTDFTSYPPAPTTTFTPPTAAPATPRTTTPPVACEEAPDLYVSVIEMSLIDSSLSLANLQSLTAPGGLVYIGADIMRGEERESSQDTWVVEDDVVYALSSSANEFTVAPDGRDLLDVNISAGDEYGSALQNCVARVRQGG